MNDPLTGFYSRSKFFTVLTDTVKRAVEFGAPVGLLVIDIQRFRNINKNFGYTTGDVVLKTVAGVLMQVRREGDYVARIGDDQFALLLGRVMNAGHARMAAIKIQQLLNVPITIKEHQIRYSATIGISLCPANASEATLLLQSAEQTLEKAKCQGLSIGLSEKMGEEIVSKDWDIEASLGDAIARSELRVFFQPKISLESGRPVGAEALVRWESPTRGLVSPAVFLPVAETINFLKPLTIWMLNSALRLSSDWTDKWGRLSVSVNIPPGILEKSDFVDLVMSAENLWQRDNVDLCLEILEQSLVSDTKVAFRKLNELRETGVKIAIDDFGTGYSSLSYFRDIPTDELKIDQSFIKGLKADKANIHIVSLIIQMAHRFGMRVIAEGVEDRDTLIYLKKKGCDEVQGYYFGKPMLSTLFSDWLEKFQPETDLLNLDVKPNVPDELKLKCKL